VRWLLGSRAVRAVLREHLRELLSEPADIRACLLRRAKLKPGRKLSAYYDVAFAGGRRPARSIAVTWQPAAEVPNRAERAEDDMEAEAVAAGLAVPFGGLRTADATLGLRILVAPLDARFPHLVRASTPEHARELVSGLSPVPTPSGDGVDDPSSYTVSAIRYRPGQRHVLRYDDTRKGLRGQGRHTFFAKLYRDGEGREAFRVACQIADWLDSSDSRTSAVRPLTYVPDDEIILYPRVTGAPLSRYPASRAGRHLEHAGRALRILQGAPVELFERVHPHSFEGELRAIARAGEHVGPLVPGAGAAVERILGRAQGLGERLIGEPPVLAHGDYKADHTWVTRRGLTLIDFNTCSLADPALDVGKFLADLRWWYSRAGEAPIRVAQQRFLDGYGSGGGEARLLRARLFEVLILTKITVRRVRLFDPAWGSQTEALISRAEHLLEELEEASRRRRPAAGVGA
jgi:hypothetical protein